MKLVKDFLMKERQSIGWRFWILFIVMTNIGFFAGLALESLLFSEINVYIGTALSGVGQSWVLSRHFSERGQWALATAVGWFVGGMLSEYVLNLMIPDISLTLKLFVFPIIAGGVTGIPLYFVLKQYMPNVGWWWVFVSAIGPAVQFPGAVMGLCIWILAHRQTLSLTSHQHDLQN